jgi:hypothetical protein
MLIKLFDDNYDKMELFQNMKSKTIAAISIFILLLLQCSGFSIPWPRTPKAEISYHDTIFQLHASYIPDGLTKEQYEKIKREEAKKYEGKNLGALGTRGFKSRSVEAWQKAHEKGQASHVFAPIGYREKLKKGLIKKEDVPYMVRGGSWDNSDVPGARRLQWNKNDIEYARGGYKKEQSASLLGSGPGLDWTGSRPRSEKNRKSFPGFS